MVKVRLSDRGDWQKAYMEVANWILEHFPEECLALPDGQRVYRGWDVEFDQNSMVFYFENPQVATLVKLTWG